jgi:carbonic anhydrase/acetyltransferase-like protein (isoleucine patch superfamily)
MIRRHAGLKEFLIHELTSCRFAGNQHKNQERTMADAQVSAAPAGISVGDASSWTPRRAEDTKADDDGEDDDNDRGQALQDDEYLMTLSHCYLSLKATLENASNVEFKGRAVVQRGCTLRGDCGIIKVGRYVWLHPGTTLHPSTMATDAAVASSSESSVKSVPLVIGSHTTVERDCHIRAAAIGSYCWIGKRVRLGQRVIIKDCCVVMDDVVLGDDTVIPPFTIVQPTAGRKPQSASSLAAKTTVDSRGALPAWSHAPTFRCMELPPSTATEMQERSIEQYATLAGAQGRGASQHR